MSFYPDNPLIAQSDLTLMLEVHNENFSNARADIMPFTELIKSPEHIHTYRVTPLSVWNAASAGLTAEAMHEAINSWSKYPVPDNVHDTIDNLLDRFGKIKLLPSDEEDYYILKIEDKKVRMELENHKVFSKLLFLHPDGFKIKSLDRGTVKQKLIKNYYPVEDLIPLKDGQKYEFTLRETCLTGQKLVIRDYQKESVNAFLGNGKIGFGFGTLVLPCGAGKTIIGLELMARLQTWTLILTTNVAAVHQWIEEIKDKTSIPPEDIGEYTGDRKEIRPITIATYQILTWRKDRNSPFPHFKLFTDQPWGLVLYDEVHLLPAPVFRVTAEIQALRRAGLTATLIREDGAEEDVFTLVGPKRYDIPWKDLEAKGWIAEASCYEIRLDLPEDLELKYAVSNQRARFRIAAENYLKGQVCKQLVEKHREDQILVIGQYVEQLKKLAKMLKAPLITGAVGNKERDSIYNDFRNKKIRVLVVSKVANFAINLPDASVAIQVSGTFGSRQEEAQRLGRILRPKKKNSYFYSLITRMTVEEEFAANRQKFLTEQGYKYHIEIWAGEHTFE